MEKSSDQEISKEIRAAIDVQLPTPAVPVGLYAYSGPERQYGTENTINAIIAIGRRWNQTHSFNIGVGDISFQNGGPMPPHTTGHQRGREVDMRPMRTDHLEQPTNISASNYSRSITRELLQAIRAQGNIRTILFNDPVLVNEGLCRPLGGHDNHLHVAFNS